MRILECKKKPRLEQIITCIAKNGARDYKSNFSIFICKTWVF